MIGHLDCSTGVSGDKFLGAVLDIGESTGTFTAADLQTLVMRLAPEAVVRVARSRSRGVSAVTVKVEAAEQPHSRRWADIRAGLLAADLPPRGLDAAMTAFSALAAAEAEVHGGGVDDVHFHEVGALDSIMDVVGTCVGLSAIGVERLTASAVATGWGSVDTSHGVLPVPAPATALLLRGIPTVGGPAVHGDQPPGELTTPTGAALLKALATSFGPSLPMVPRQMGYGMGTRDIGSPNVCRLTIGDAAALPALTGESVTLLEANVDHISAEAIAFAAEQLLAEGALDVWAVPITMKKGRPALMLCALVASRDASDMSSRVVDLTGTLGVRVSEQPRLVAQRRHETMATEWGEVRVKIGPLGGSTEVARPESDDVARIARQTFQPFSAVQRLLADMARERFGGE